MNVYTAAVRIMCSNGVLAAVIARGREVVAYDLSGPHGPAQDALLRLEACIDAHRVLGDHETSMGQHRAVVVKLAGHVLGCIYPHGDPVAKSLRRMMRRAAKLLATSESLAPVVGVKGGGCSTVGELPEPGPAAGGSSPARASIDLGIGRVPTPLCAAMEPVPPSKWVPGYDTHAPAPDSSPPSSATIHGYPESEGDR